MGASSAAPPVTRLTAARLSSSITTILSALRYPLIYVGGFCR
jgi:hypothetical protein